MNRAMIVTWLAAVAFESFAAAPGPLVPTDLFRFQEVEKPAISPDGAWIAYQVTHQDAGRDESGSSLWLVSWDGTQNRQLTRGDDDSAAGWSPDGRYLTFLATRDDAESRQLWRLDMRGGEAERLTEVAEGVSHYAWSPDGRKLVLVVQDAAPAPEDDTDTKAPAPIVVDRWQFKEDYIGYLNRRRTHLYVLDLQTRGLTQLTSGDFDDRDPSWSPDGRRLAFVRNAGPEIDRLGNTDVFVIDAVPGAEPRPLTRFAGADHGPVWSPDGRWIAFLRGGDPKYSMYVQDRVAVVAPDGGGERVLTEDLDRPVEAPRWTPDGRSILFLLEDDRTVQVARVAIADGRVERLTQGPHVIDSFATSGDGKVALAVTSDHQPTEIAALDGLALRVLTRHNDPALHGRTLAEVLPFSAKAPDGNTVNALAFLPPGFEAGRRYPTIVYIHGGPFMQDGHYFDFERQVFAAPGYVVLAVNYRGSSGRGEAYSKALFADWGNKDVVDVLAAVDEAIARGWSDPDRLFVGGWSYGGQLTNWLIASTTRFKAAVAGAGAGMYLSSYGIDEYVQMWESELGFPWDDLEPWLKVSYPFIHADRIRTPTLYMGGSLDFNMPIAGSEQMYQALRSQGVPTQLVVYPETHHWFSAPSHYVDMLDRYLAWWAKFGGAEPLPRVAEP